MSADPRRQRCNSRGNVIVAVLNFFRGIQASEPPQSRLPLRRPSRADRAIGLTAAVAVLTALLVVALGPVPATTLKEAVDRLCGYPAWHRRAALAALDATPYLFPGLVAGRPYRGTGAG